jgi:integrase
VESRKTRKWGIGPERTFDEVKLAYLETHQDKKSAERDRYSTVHLHAVFSQRKINAITGTDIREYIRARQAQGIAAGTISRELGLLSAACNWVKRELEWDIRNPVAGRKPREPQGRIRWLTRAEATALLQASSGHLRDFIQLALHTGMRRGELLNLGWRRVDLSEGLIYLGEHDQKSGKVGSVPLNREAKEALISRARFRAVHCPGSPWVFAHENGSRLQSVRRSFATACKAVGITDFHMHDLRHTCAAWAVQAGAPLLEVCHLLRHSDIRMTMRYAHLAPEHVRAVVERLENRDTSGVYDQATPGW